MPLLLLGIAAACQGPADATVLGSSTTLPPPEPSTSDDSGGDTGIPDLPDPGLPPGGCDGDGGCDNRIDLLFVIDNSGTMADEQLNLARQFGALIDRLQDLEGPGGQPANVDVNIMVTTTDMWNPECAGPWVKPDYEAAHGAPIVTACTERPNRFVDFFGQDFGHVCTQVCTNGAAPSDPFIHFSGNGDNVVGGSPAQALSCLGPQGVDGCGFESPLESMMQALDPDACWNDPDGCTDEDWQWVQRPFLRDDSVLAVVLITDEVDCSIKNAGLMTDPDFMELDPSGEPTVTSAVCWNGGVACTGYDPATGRYSECHAANYDLDGQPVPPEQFGTGVPVLQPIDRYVDYLHALRDGGREVVMLGILGVPEVTEHADVPPYQPIAGGVHDLEYRDWSDADVLPTDAADGESAASMQAQFGIGPGCTGQLQPDGSTTGQAIPPVRIRQVCESLDDDDRVRCCIESICGDDFSPAIRCLTDIIQDTIDPIG